ncbi:hypothetical protein COLO4_01966, partial [Corchorus olitorius]
MQAGTDQRGFARAARAGEQHVVGRAAGHELLGVARDLVLLHIDVLQVGQLHGADMAHGLQQTAAVGALAIAPGDGGIPVCGGLQRLGQDGLDALHQLLGALHELQQGGGDGFCGQCHGCLSNTDLTATDAGYARESRWISCQRQSFCAPAAIESWQQPGTRPAAAGGTVGGESGAVVGVDAHVVVAQIA